MKKPSLAEALSSPDPSPSQSVQAAVMEPPRGPKVAPSPKRPPSRVGKKPITGYYAPEVSKQLRRMSLDMDRSLENLLAEALNDFFRKHKKPTIA